MERCCTLVVRTAKKRVKLRKSNGEREREGESETESDSKILRLL